MTEEDPRPPRASRSAAYTLAAQGGKVLINALSLIVLSRLLAPDAFGLAAMAAVVVSLAELVRDLGLSLAAIRAKHLTQGQKSNLFWLNTASGLLLTALLWIGAPFVAALYGQPRTIEIFQLVSVVFLINAVGAQLRVELIRRSSYRLLAGVDVVSQGAALLVAVFIAATTHSYLALAAQQVTGAAALTLLTAFFARWVPSLPSRNQGTGQFLSFGANLIGVQVLTYAGRNIDTFMIGRLFGATSLGYYSRAYSLFSQPIQLVMAPITNLVVQRLSVRLHAGEDLRTPVLLAQRVTLGAAVPGLAVLAGAADPITRVVLGDGWGPTALLFPVLALGGIFQLMGQCFYWLFLASGRADLQLRCTLISQPIGIVLVLAAAPFGFYWVAWAMTASMLVEYAVPAVWASRRLPAPAREIPRRAIGFLGLGVAVFVAARAGAVAAPNGSTAVALVLSLGAGAALVALLALLMPWCRQIFLDILSAARSLRA